MQDLLEKVLPTETRGVSLHSNKVSRAEIPKIEVFDNAQIRKSIGGGIRGNK